MGGCGLMEDVSDLLGAVVGDFDTDKCLICREGLTKAFLLTLREPITTGAQKKPDLIEGIPLASAVTQGVLLDAAAHLTWSVASLCDDVTGIEHAGGVLGAGQAMAFLLSLEGDPESRSGYRSETVRRALLASSHARCQTFPEQGPLKRAVGCSSPRIRSTMPVSSRGPSSASVLVMPHASHQPPAPKPPRNGQDHQMRLADTARYGTTRYSTWLPVVEPILQWWLPRSAAVGSPSGSPAHPDAPGGSHLLVVLQECHRLAGGFAAYPAPYCATGSLAGLRPRARRSPAPPYDRGLERFSPQPGQPAQRSQDSISSTRASGVRTALIRWKPSKSTSRSRRSQRSSDTEQQVG